MFKFICIHSVLFRFLLSFVAILLFNYSMIYCMGEFYIYA